MKPYPAEHICQSCEETPNAILPLPSGKRAKEYTVLIIDEKPSYFAFVDGFFKANGFNVKKVRSDAEGLLEYQKNRKTCYAMFISSEFCEKTVESIKKLRKWEDKHGVFPKHRVSIIVASSNIQDSFRLDCSSLNVKDVYDKPLNQQDTIAIFKTLLRNQIPSKQYHALRLYVQGISYKKAAETLGVKESTYASHLITIQQKFDINRRAGLRTLSILFENEKDENTLETCEVMKCQRK